MNKFTAIADVLIVRNSLVRNFNPSAAIRIAPQTYPPTISFLLKEDCCRLCAATGRSLSDTLKVVLNRRKIYDE